MKSDAKTTHFAFFLEVLKVVTGIHANIPESKMYKCLNAVCLKKEDVLFCTF